jgi:hypothetical protein
MPDEQDEFEEAWAQIVADLTSGRDPDAPRDASSDGSSIADATADPPADPPADPTAGLSALFEPLRRPPSTPEPDERPSRDPGAFVDNWQDEGHFEPPPPPEIPVGTPVKRLAWAGVLGGPTTLALVALTGWDAPRILSIAAGLVTIAGFVTLVWLLPDSREDSGWDDGARL